MAVNKVEYAGMVLLDLTEDTISPDTVLAGYTGHDKSGQPFVGTLEIPDNIPVIQTSGSLTVSAETDSIQIDTGLDEVYMIRIVGSNISYVNEDKFSDEWLYDSKLNLNQTYYKTVSETTILGSTSLLVLNYSEKGGVSINGGTVTAQQYGTTYPIFGGVYKWVAVGRSESNDLVCIKGSAVNSTESENFTIDTGLESITGLIAYFDCTDTDYTSNYLWILCGDENKCLSISSKNWLTLRNSNKVSISGGEFTIAQYSSSYPVSAGAIKYVVWGKSGSGDSTPTLQSKSVTPSEAQQTVSPDSGYDGLSQVTVGAISKTYIGSGVTKKSAQTYTPGTANQTIASGQYLNGVQTILGDSDLIASNIKKGVSIFNVTGTYEAASSGGSSNDNCEAYLVDVTDPTVSFKRTDGTLKAWGYAYVTSSSGWTTTTTVYAFAGDKYYKSATYGSPTSTSLTLGESGGKLTGLPTLTGGELLITKGI